jgi:DNA-binding beta-propeller fold protein YncE
MLNLSDGFVSTIISSDMTYALYAAASGDKLYYTNTNTNTVTCCDLHGTTQWEFKDNCVLQGPLGISVDNDGNVVISFKIKITLFNGVYCSAFLLLSSCNIKQKSRTTLIYN